MKKILGIFFGTIFLISVILSTVDSITSSVAMQNSNEKYSAASTNPIKIGDTHKVDFAKNK